MQGSVKRLVEACGRPEQQRQRIDGLTGATATAERGGRGENAGHCRRRTRRPSSQTVTEEAHRLFVWQIISNLPGQNVDAAAGRRRSQNAESGGGHEAQNPRPQRADSPALGTE